MLVYFKPLRRRFGLVALMVASVSMVGWMTCLGKWSSHSQGASYGLRSGKASSDVYFVDCGDFRWISLNESLIWTNRSKADSDNPPFLYWDVERPFGPSSFFEFREMRWKWQWGGFGVGNFEELAYFVEKGVYDVAANPFWMIPYWAIVIPLTLLTAWLLLSKPRPPKPSRDLSK